MSQFPDELPSMFRPYDFTRTELNGPPHAIVDSAQLFEHLENLCRIPTDTSPCGGEGCNTVEQDHVHAHDRDHNQGQREQEQREAARQGRQGRRSEQGRQGQQGQKGRQQEVRAEVHEREREQGQGKQERDEFNATNEALVDDVSIMCIIFILHV